MSGANTPARMTTPATMCSRHTGKPVLDGDASGTVLTVLWDEVLIEGLTIEDGMAIRCWFPKVLRPCGGGITNRGGTLRLRDVVVRRNRGKDAGGIYNTGTLVLEGATRIIGNTCSAAAVQRWLRSVERRGVWASGGVHDVSRSLDDLAIDASP